MAIQKTKVSKRKNELMSLVKDSINSKEYGLKVAKLMSRTNASMREEAYIADGIEQNIRLLDIEELLMLGSNYDRPDAHDDSNISFSWKETGGEFGLSTYTISSGEYKVVIIFDKNTETIKVESKSHHASKLIRQYILGRAAGAVH